jgi:tetratricopeptide (TPR) repeat protein
MTRSLTTSSGRLAVIGGLLLALTQVALAGDFQAELRAVQDAWAVANYEVPAGEAREAAFERLAGQAAALSAAWPDHAEALVWEGIVYSTQAGVNGGLGALGLAKKARARLEAAIELDDTVLAGSAYTSLGTLYHKVPGFPIGFGSDKKARTYLEKAIAMNPEGIDPNFFYGEFLLDEGDYAGAVAHLEKGLAAEPRPGRELADQGRREEIRVLLTRAREKLARSA